MAVKRIQKNRKNDDGNFDVIHYETEASIVLMEDGNNVESALSSIVKVADEKVVLPADGWNASSKTQAVSVYGVSADSSKHNVDVYPDENSSSAYQAAGITYTVSTPGCVTFTAATLPSSDLTVYVAVEVLSF